MLSDEVLRALKRRAELEALEADEQDPERLTWLCYAEAVDEVVRFRHRNNGRAPAPREGTTSDDS